jgi:hypothetical protein
VLVGLHSDCDVSHRRFRTLGRLFLVVDEIAFDALSKHNFGAARCVALHTTCRAVLSFNVAGLFARFHAICLDTSRCAQCVCIVERSLAVWRCAHAVQEETAVTNVTNAKAPRARI